MATKEKDGKGVKGKREVRDMRDQTILELLRTEGRELVFRKAFGSVRVSLRARASHRPEEVPVLLEWYRRYSTSEFIGLTSLLEASDLCHALRGLSAAVAKMQEFDLPFTRPDPLPEHIVLQSAIRGYAKVEHFVHGNVVALLWANDVDGGLDTVTKVELLSVPVPDLAVCFIETGQIPDARECLLDASKRIDEIHRRLGF
jgi:hypothetical protein